MRVLMSKANENSSLPTFKTFLILVLATWILSAPCEGLDHDLDIPNESPVYQLCTTKSVHSTIQIEFLHQQCRTACGSVSLIFPPFQSWGWISAAAWDTSKGQASLSRKLLKQIIPVLMTGTLLTWSQEASGVPDEMCIKNNTFAVITEQEKVKFLVSQCTVQCAPTGMSTAVIKGHILLKLSINGNNSSHIHARQSFLQERDKLCGKKI